MDAPEAIVAKGRARAKLHTGAVSRMGLSFVKLHANNPKLIVCDISGYGAQGPCRERAHDLLI